MNLLARAALSVSCLVAAGSAEAVTYQVGPTRAHTTLASVASLLRPGDVVEVDAGTYAAVRFTQPGAAGRPITVRGVSTPRPVIAGGANTVELAGDHYVFENFELRGGTSRCLYHHADDIVVRNAVVHDCPAQGILGADQDSGSLLLEYVEVHHCGSGTYDHQIYMATDEVAHPGSVFRMQFCYVHDANGGNDVKSRAERNEIYANWIEGALYHELELIGPDPGGAQDGWSEGLAREDSDVVGNVLRATGTFPLVRVGGDGTGQSRGRYRFVNNTFVSNAGGGAVMRVFDGVESIEMHNNAFYATGGVVNVSRTAEAAWTSGEVFEGDDNWVMTGATNIPRGFRGTLTGASPGFVNATAFDLRPTATSPLVDHGVMTTVSPAGHAFTRPLALPMFHPPQRVLLAPGTAMARPTSGRIDVGAWEYAPATPPTDVPAVDATTDVVTPTDVVTSRDAGTPTDIVRTDVVTPRDVVTVIDVVTPRDVVTADAEMADAATVDAIAVTDAVVRDEPSVSDDGTTRDDVVIADAPTVDELATDDVNADADAASTTGAAKSGCGCRSVGAAPGAPWLLAVALCVRRRRRLAGR